MRDRHKVGFYFLMGFVDITSIFNKKELISDDRKTIHTYLCAMNVATLSVIQVMLVSEEDTMADMPCNHPSV